MQLMQLMHVVKCSSRIIQKITSFDTRNWGALILQKKLLFHRKNCNKKISQYISIQIEARQETLKSARPCLPAPTWIALCQLFSSAFSFSYIQKSNYRRLGYYHLELVGRDQTIESQRLEGGSHTTSHCRKCFEEATRSAKQTP